MSSDRRIYGARPMYKAGFGNLLDVTIAVFPDDPAAFWEGFCPNCRVQLAGSVANWCPQCKTYWNATPGQS